MIELQKHIKHLLLLHDCVIVPEIGGFVINTVSADCNENTGIFSPPKREIIFNHNLSHNDGLLLNQVALQCEITYSEAQREVANITSQWKKSLKNNEVIILSEVGSLKADNNNTISFTASNENSISPNMFGLTTFHFKSLEQVNELKTPTRHLVQRTVQSKGLRQIAASVALIIGLLAISPDVNNTAKVASFTSLSPTSVPTETKVNANNIKVDETNTHEELINKDTDSNIEEVATEVKNKYFLIAGSFKENTQAEKFVKRLNQRNINTATILPTNNGRIRVALDGFADKNDAMLALKDYRKQNGFNSVWIFTDK